MARNKVERLNEAFNYLRYNGLIATQKDVSDALGSSPSNISKALKGDERVLTDNFLVRFSDTFSDISSAWLLTGEGKMLKANIKLDKPMEFAPAQMDEALRVAEKMGVDLIPLYTEPFRAGNEGHSLREEWDEVESVWAIPDTHATRLAPVRGNSMEPTLHDGDVVAIKRMEFRIDEPLSIPFGEVFGIVVRTSDDPDDREYLDYIKRLVRHPDHDKHLTHWIAQSDNEKYKDFEIRIDRVASLWRVKASIAVQRFS
jgi:phage repressor protein C with HTH and peptisase S24 domain